MKKLFLMAVVAMMATMSVNAQQMFIKPMVGATLSNLTDADHSKMKVGVVGGIEYGYHLADPFAVTAGLLVSMQGCKFDDTSYTKDYTSTLTYVNVPIMANYYIIPGLAIKAGVQPGFLVGRKTKLSQNTGAGWQDEEYTDTDGMKKFDFSIPVGLSYEISNIVIDARYNFGLTKISDDGISKSKNSVIMLTLGYKIPF